MQTTEYVEQRDGGYYVAGTRISLGSVVYAFNEGKSPGAQYGNTVCGLDSSLKQSDNRGWIAALTVRPQ